MINPDTSGWKHVGDTTNTRYYLIEPHVLGAVPNQGSSDDAASARANTDFQNAFLRENGGGAVVIFFDRMVSQDKDARRVYQTEPDPTVFHGAALVGGSALSRAMGSFFLGLSKPKVPLKMFASTEAALEWARGLGRTGGG